MPVRKQVLFASRGAGSAGSAGSSVTRRAAEDRNTQASWQKSISSTPRNQIIAGIAKASSRNSTAGKQGTQAEVAARHSGRRKKALRPQSRLSGLQVSISISWHRSRSRSEVFKQADRARTRVERGPIACGGSSSRGPVSGPNISTRSTRNIIQVIIVHSR